MSSITAPPPRVGALLREWRERRRLSQMTLALETGVSARHLSFVETGRSRPSAEMVLRLAEQLEVPLREQNQLLLAAGHAPRYGQRHLDEPDMEPVRDALRLVLEGHEPCPAIVVDRHWGLVDGNSGVALFVAGAAPELLEPPVNVLRLALHPDGIAPRIANLGEWRAHLLERLEREVVGTGDPALQTLLEELRGYPDDRDGDPSPTGAPGIGVPLRVRGPGGVLSFLSTVTTFGTPADVTLSELSIETFFPADAATWAALRAVIP